MRIVISWRVVRGLNEGIPVKSSTQCLIHHLSVKVVKQNPNKPAFHLKLGGCFVY